MSTTERCELAFLDWQAERAEFKANPTEERLASLKKASDRHIEAARQLARERKHLVTV